MYSLVKAAFTRGFLRATDFLRRRPYEEEILADKRQVWQPFWSLDKLIKGENWMSHIREPLTSIEIDI